MDLPKSLRTTALVALLDQQAGLVSVTQLRTMHFGTAVARRWVSTGRWQRLHPGVYDTFSGPLGRTAQVWAALLRVGPGATTSHATAAELDGLTGRIDDRIHVTAPVSRRVRGQTAGLVVHYAHRLPLTRHPSKNPPRTRIEDTILDLIDTSARARDVESFVTMGVQKRLTTTSKLAATLMRRKKIRWRALTESMLLDVADGAQSPLELEHLRRVERAHGLPTGWRQRRHTGSRVIWTDVDYGEYDTRVELDGRLGHEGDGRFRDRRRDNLGTVSGAWTLRYGHAEIFGTPCEVAGEQAALLHARAWSGPPGRCDPACVAGNVFDDHLRSRATANSGRVLRAS